MSNFTDGGTVCSFIVKKNNLVAKASLCLVLANGHLWNNRVWVYTQDQYSDWNNYVEFRRLSVNKQVFPADNGNVNIIQLMNMLLALS